MADEKDLSMQADDELVEEAAESTEKPEKSGKGDKDAKGKSGKDGKKKGPGLGKRFVKYFRDLRGEFKKINWPPFPTVVRNTGVTLAMCAILGVVICLIDLGLGFLVDLLVK